MPRAGSAPIPEGVIALAESAVTRPLPFTVAETVCVASPNDPGEELTVARVADTLPTPEAVTSPVNAVIPALAPEAIPSSLVLSAADMLPAALSVAALIAIVGVVPPLLVIGAVAPTEVTGDVPLDAAVMRPSEPTVKPP